MDACEVNLPESRARQQRVMQEMERARLDYVVVHRLEHVQWLTGPRFAPVFEAAAALSKDGRATLIAPHKSPPAAAADEVVPFAAKWHSTLRNDQREAANDALLAAVPELRQARRVGVEFSVCGPSLTQRLAGEVVEFEPTLFRLRRRKHPDELARLRHAIAATGAMYARARAIVAPGVNELELFNALQSVAVETLGEPLTGTGNDYACAERGGPPRNRRAQAGELYILDLGPAFRGYFADNCRTLAVDRRPTDAQHRAWEAVASVFPLLERLVRPGVSCREVFNHVQRHLDAVQPGGFNHHLGHGIGLCPHEAPHLNPHWDDRFEVGDVFTAEPGLYGPELRAGIRLENDYLVTATGVELLSDFPLELAID